DGFYAAGEVARYIGRHGARRVAMAVLISSVPPLDSTLPEKSPVTLDGMAQDVSPWPCLLALCRPWILRCRRSRPLHWTAWHKTCRHGRAYQLCAAPDGEDGQESRWLTPLGLRWLPSRSR